MNFVMICKMNEIDYTLCETIGNRGYDVYFSYTAENMENAEKLMNRSDGKSKFRGTLIKLEEKESISRMMEGLSAEKLSLDCLLTSINTCYAKPANEISADEVKLMISENINSLYYAVKQALPMMIESKGMYCNITDSSAYFSVKDMAAYAMTEAASIGFIKSFAKEYARYGVRAVNFVTDFVSNEYVKSKLSTYKLSEARNQRFLKKFAEVDEVCGQIADFICSSKIITGQSIFLDNLATDYIFC